MYYIHYIMYILYVYLIYCIMYYIHIIIRYRIYIALYYIMKYKYILYYKYKWYTINTSNIKKQNCPKTLLSEQECSYIHIRMYVHTCQASVRNFVCLIRMASSFLISFCPPETRSSFRRDCIRPRVGQLAGWEKEGWQGRRWRMM